MPKNATADAAFVSAKIASAKAHLQPLTTTRLNGEPVHVGLAPAAPPPAGAAWWDDAASKLRALADAWKHVSTGTTPLADAPRIAAEQAAKDIRAAATKALDYAKKAKSEAVPALKKILLDVVETTATIVRTALIAYALYLYAES